MATIAQLMNLGFEVERDYSLQVTRIVSDTQFWFYNTKYFNLSESCLPLFEKSKVTPEGKHQLTIAGLYSDTEVSPYELVNLAQYREIDRAREQYAEAISKLTLAKRACLDALQAPKLVTVLPTE